MQRRPPSWPLGSLCHDPSHAPARGAEPAVVRDSAKSRSKVEPHPTIARSGSTMKNFKRASYHAGRNFHPIPAVPPTEGCPTDRKETSMRLTTLALLALAFLPGTAPAGEEAQLAIHLPLGR